MDASYSAQVESLEPRRLLSIAAVTPDGLVIAGTAKNDTITLQSAKNDSGTAVVTRNGVTETYPWPQFGRVRIEGRRGNDTIRIFSDYRVTVLAGGGNDVVYAGSSPITALGEDGNDTLYGSKQTSDYLIGGAGDDYIDGGRGSDAIYGDNYPPITHIVDADVVDGNDTLIGGKGFDLVDGDGGNDLIYGGDDPNIPSYLCNTLLGGVGNDTIYGGIGGDSIEGNAGNDLIVAGAGNDTISGNKGHDTIDAGDGNDTIYGGPDTSDTIFGGNGNDSAAKDDKDTYDSVETLLT